jgi:phage FluMu gp28-like protein
MALRNPKSDAEQTGENGPRIRLYPYQEAWIADETRFKFWVASRQIGKDFCATLRQVRKRIKFGGLTVWIAASDRQSLEAMEKVRMHLDALRTKFEYEEIEFPKYEEKARQVSFSHNGGRILALPANPDTIRGYTGDVVLNEFAFHRDPVKIWRAALAIVSRGFQLEVISTPNGQQGKYWELARKLGVPAIGAASQARWQSDVWSVHWVDVHSAVAQGCPLDIKALRAAADDEDTWLQEEECVFLADAENYIPMELIVVSEHTEATVDLPRGFLEGPHGDLFLGMDVGRKKDRSDIWLREKVGDVFWTRMVLGMERTPFNIQRQQLFEILPHVRRACIDATGIGAQLAEEAVQKFGAKVEAVVFNLENKERMATGLKASLENRKERIPASAAIRRAFNAVKRYSAPTGHFRFDAERTDAGHADEFWAAALSGAASATSGPAAACAGNDDIEEVPVRRRSVFEERTGRRGEAAIEESEEEEPVHAGVLERARRGLFGVRGFLR